jgi:hypothetical protein
MEYKDAGDNQDLILLLSSSRFLSSPDSWEPILQSSLAQEFCHSSLLDNNNNHGQPLNHFGFPCPIGDFFILLYLTSYLSFSCSASNFGHVGFSESCSIFYFTFFWLQPNELCCVKRMFSVKHHLIFKISSTLNVFLYCQPSNQETRFLTHATLLILYYSFRSS